MQHTTSTELLLLLVVSASVLVISHASSLQFHYISPRNFTTTAATTSSPSSAHHNRNPSLAILHRDATAGATYPSRRHAVLGLVVLDNDRAEYLVRRLSLTYLPTDFGSEVVSGLDEGSGEVSTSSASASARRLRSSTSSWTPGATSPGCNATRARSATCRSTSFSGLSCGSAICRMLPGSCCGESGRCQYEVEYGDGSYTKGVLALETLTIGGTAVQGVAIGCGHRNRGLFVGAAGLLGLGWGPMSLVGQLGGAFSYCLASRGPGSNAGAGSLVLGRTEAVPVGAVWVPLVRNAQAPSFYYVGLTGIGVGGAKLPLQDGLFQLTEDGGGGVVMDTGTAVTRLPQEAFAGAVGGLPRAGHVAVRHVLRPERVRERARADRVVLLRRRRHPDAAGEEPAGRDGWRCVLPGVRAVVVGPVHPGEHTAARDPDHRRLGIWLHWVRTSDPIRARTRRIDGAIQLHVLAKCRHVQNGIVSYVLMV